MKQTQRENIVDLSLGVNPQSMNNEAQKINQLKSSVKIESKVSQKIDSGKIAQQFSTEPSLAEKKKSIIDSSKTIGEEQIHTTQIQTPQRNDCCIII